MYIINTFKGIRGIGVRCPLSGPVRPEISVAEEAREGGRMTDPGAYYASSINNVEKTSGQRERERESDGGETIIIIMKN